MEEGEALMRKRNDLQTPCGKMLPLALMMLPLVMWRNRRELRGEWRKMSR